MENKISSVLSQEAVQKIDVNIGEIRNSLPFLVDLTKDERRKKLKLGDKSQVFARNAHNLAQKHIDVLPRKFDVDEFGKDVQLFDQLYKIKQNLTQLMELVDDTVMQVGHETYSNVLISYKYLKDNKISSEGLDNNIDALGKLFVKKVSTTTEE